MPEHERHRQRCIHRRSFSRITQRFWHWVDDYWSLREKKHLWWNRCAGSHKGPESSRTWIKFYRVYWWTFGHQNRRIDQSAPRHPTRCIQRLSHQLGYCGDSLWACLGNWNRSHCKSSISSRGPWVYQRLVEHQCFQGSCSKRPYPIWWISQGSKCCRSDCQAWHWWLLGWWSFSQARLHEDCWRRQCSRWSCTMKNDQKYK